jgi:hypothetical protein
VGPQGGPYRYREGVRISDPVDDDLNRLRFNFHTKYRQVSWQSGRLGWGGKRKQVSCIVDMVAFSVLWVGL